MSLLNWTHVSNNWYHLPTVLVCTLLLVSCVPTTYQSAGSEDTARERAVDIYDDIKKLSDRLSTSSDKTDAEILIEKSQSFIHTYPKYNKTDEVYFILGQTLLQFDRAAEAIDVLNDLNRDYPYSSYISESLLTLGIAYDNVGKHDQADQTYNKLISDRRFSGSKNVEAAQQLLATDRTARKGALSELSAENPLDKFIGKPALDFKVTDLNGEALSLEKYRGKIILLDFWATWCPPCIQEMPHLKQTYTKFKNQGFIIIGISADRGLDPLKSFVSEENITWPQHFDNGGQIAKMYNLTHIPTTFLIDGKGIVQAVNLKGNALEAAVAQLVIENSYR
ncbi:redoxin domain-containing protein [Candidatus Poribacteria bacterium]|nr:redoxin domain-containing protein [Candidatus Poribacteria bacterium]MYB63182.1 redoxin domain-containing protein [Candidatus Poribacteria bacterium]MYF56679.1 redoxin domain-containing protein [Candidatus Poribacteria bacterium]